jgi:hypothetical protein
VNPSIEKRRFDLWQILVGKKTPTMTLQKMCYVRDPSTLVSVHHHMQVPSKKVDSLPRRPAGLMQSLMHRTTRRFGKVDKSYTFFRTPSNAFPPGASSMLKTWVGAAMENGAVTRSTKHAEGRSGLLVPAPVFLPTQIIKLKKE